MTYAIQKYDSKTDTLYDYGKGHTEEDLKAITKGYTLSDTQLGTMKFYTRKGSRYTFSVTEQ